MTTTKPKARPTDTAIAAILAVIFILTGVSKLVGLPMMAEQFAGWGYPTWFMYVIGIAELAGAGLLISSRMRRYGAFLIGIIMVGAIATHVRADEFALSPVPLAILAVCLWLLRRPMAPPAPNDRDREATTRERPAAMDSR